MQTITDLLSTQTQDQIRASLVNALVQLGIRADLWRKGGGYSLILTVVAAFLAAFQRLVVQTVGFGFLPTAAGGWLTLLAFYVYGVTRPQATFATGQVTLTNTGGGTFNYDPGQVTVLNSTTKATYTNAEPIALAPLSAQTLDVQAVDPGSGGNAAPGQIDSLQTTMLLVTVTNALAVLGSDALLDADLRTMCLNSLGAQSVRGPRNVYAFAAQVAVSPTTGLPVNVNRTARSISSHTGQVTVWCAAPQGAPTSDDLEGVSDSIENGVPGLNPPFSGARPDGVTVFVNPVTTVPYSAPLIVWAQALPGLAESDLEATIASELDDLFRTYPVGGLSTDTTRGLFGSRIEGAVESVNTAIFKVETPGAPNTPNVPLPDLPLVDGEVPVNAITSITVRLV